MHDVNWWLMALAFLIGLVLTFALMIRRVTREVPVTHAVSAGVTAAGAAAKVRGAAEKVHGDVHAVREKVHEDVRATAEKVHEDVHTLAQKVDTVESRGIIEAAPFGSGSIRVTRRSTAPAGYRLKGLKKTGRYYTVESPDYEALETEFWFSDDESAEKAGFLRWDAEAGAAAGLVAATFAAVGEVPDGPYGQGSATAGADGSGPAGWTIKGNADSMLYHTTDSQWYGQTIAEVWFVDEETAKKAGFDKWDKNLG